MSVENFHTSDFPPTTSRMSNPFLGCQHHIPLREGGWHVARFEVGDTEPAEAVEALFLDSEFFENRVQRAAKEARLKKWSPRASPEEKALFPVASEIPEHGRNGRMQVHLTETVHRLWSLDSTFQARRSLPTSRS